MTKKPISLAIGLALVSTVYSNEIQDPGNAEMPVLRNAFPNFDIARAAATFTGGMNIDGNSGDLSVSNYEARALLSRPIEIFEGFSMIPFFNYEFTELNFDGTGAFPIGDEDLQSVSLQAIFFKQFANSPWLGVGWTRAEFASDGHGTTNEDLTFDFAAGIGYKFNDSFTLGAGFAVLDINGKERFFPGINFDWTPTEKFRVGLYGPNLFTRYQVNDGWYLSLEGTPNGGVWNINDNSGQSRNLELNSYAIGLNTHHRITQKIWMSLGVGYTVGNEIEIRDNGPSFSRDMDGAMFARVSVSLRQW